MVRISLLPAFVMFVGTLSPSTEVCASRDGPQETADLTQGLLRFESSFNGLSYHVEIAPVSGVASFTGRVWISKSGRVRKAEVTNVGLDFRTISGIVLDSQSGWCFISSERHPSLPGNETASATIAFLNPGSDVATIISRCEDGFVDGIRFSRYVSEAATVVKEVVDNGANYTALVCDHPTRSSASFLFDETKTLRIVKIRREPGDKVGGSVHVPPAVVPPGTWSEQSIGPIEYEVFEGKTVPIIIPSAVSASGGLETGTNTRFHDFEINDQDVSNNLTFPGLSIPDGTRVTSQGDLGLRYELRGGIVAKIVDADGLSAANGARMGGYLRSRSTWYLVSSLLLILTVAFLIWNRTHERSMS